MDRSVSDARDSRGQPWFAEAGRELSNATIAFHDAVAKRLGLHITDHKALGYLFERGPMPAGRLGELTGLTTGSVTAMIDRLERRGYVRRERDPADRRKVIIAPTDDAAKHEGIRALFGPLQRAFDRHLPSYTEEDQRLIRDFMERNVAALREATRILCGDEEASGR